jgi:hypothetical protein
VGPCGSTAEPQRLVARFKCSDVVGKEWNPQIVVNLSVTNVLGCVSRNAKTLGLQHLQPMDVGVRSGPTDRACVVHHTTDELLVEQHAVLNGQTAPPVKERAKHAQFLSRLSPYLLTCADQVSRVSGVTPRYRAV